MDKVAAKPASSSILKWILVIFLFLIFYVATCIPVGLFLYTAKSNLGINVFSKTGFHSYTACLRSEAEKIQWQEKRKERHHATEDTKESKDR